MLRFVPIDLGCFKLFGCLGFCSVLSCFVILQLCVVVVGLVYLLSLLLGCFDYV